MKIKYVSHASLQAVFDNGKKLLTDPWQYDPIYGNSLWQFPPCKLTAEEFVNQDYLYISHLHPDHLCFNTLEHFNRDIPILIRKYDHGLVPLAKKLKDFGFKTVIEIKHRETIELEPGIQITLLADERTNDSSIVLSASGHSVYMQNDCLLPEAEMQWVGENFHIDLACLFFMGIGPYPGSFDMPLAKKKIILEEKKRFCFERAYNWAKLLKCKNVLPYSSDMAWLRRPDLVELYAVTPHEFKQYMLSQDPSFNVLQLVSGEIYEFGTTANNYSNYFTRETYLQSFHLYRQEPKNQLLIQHLQDWENSFTLDVEQFKSLFSAYCEHTVTTKKFTQLTQDIQIAFVIKMPNEKFQALILYFGNEKKSIRSIDHLPKLEEGYHMIAFIEHNLLAMAIDGAYTFEDLLNNRYFIQREVSFNINENYFWNFMEAFSWFLEEYIPSKNQKNEHKKYKMPTFVFRNEMNSSDLQYDQNNWQSTVSDFQCACVSDMEEEKATETSSASEH